MAKELDKDGVTLVIPRGEMTAALARLRRMERPLARRALALAAEGINSEAQVRAPVKTGELKASHLADLANPDRPRIGATVVYAAAVHARHPADAGWYRRAIVEGGPSIVRKAMERALRESVR